MKPDHTKTPVQFYVEPDGQVLAYFPRMRHNSNAMTCYAHVGQHSACTPEYIAELTEATPEQYADLKAELESIGYKLKMK